MVSWKGFRPIAGRPIFGHATFIMILVDDDITLGRFPVRWYPLILSLLVHSHALNLIHPVKDAT